MKVHNHDIFLVISFPSVPNLAMGKLICRFQYINFEFYVILQEQPNFQKSFHLEFQHNWACLSYQLRLRPCLS